MIVFTQWISAIMAVLMGLPLLLSSVFQSYTKIGYDGRPANETVIANFLEGDEEFIDEAVGEYWSAGFAKRSLTPEDGGDNKYFLGGYLRFPAQTATGVIDDIQVRVVCLDDNSGSGAVAFAWIDTIGLMNADVKAIRAALSDLTDSGKIKSIDIGSTHTHSAIDTQGLWGYLPQSGRNEEYIASLVEKTAAAIREAYENLTPGTLYYTSENHKELFSDGRTPYVMDENIHLFRFVPFDENLREIYMTNFGAHGVNVDWTDTRISADFPYYIDTAINEQADADFIFIQGAIGGGINCRMSEANGITQDVSEYEKMKEYSVLVADIICAMAEKGEEVEPILNVAHAQVDVEVDNFIFLLAERTGICNANAFKENGKIYLTTEIGLVEIGKNIKILEVPGEALPEIVYGNFLSADKATNGTEYEYAALKTAFAEDDEILVFGLCNDALGYFVPDNDYSTSEDSGHYEESVSTGSTAASTLSKAFFELIEKYN